MDAEKVKEAVRDKYGKIAATATSCCGPNCGCGDGAGPEYTVLMNDEYQGIDKTILESADLGLGCGTPAAFADLAEGMTVLDLGSGAGIDVFIAAKAVGPAGKVIGVDMTDEMLVKANANRQKLGIAHAEFRKGEIEDLPVLSASVDRVISNCVINLVPDKRRAFAEIFRVLKPGGRFTVSDIVSVGQIPEDLRKDMLLWAGCVAGALDKEEYLSVVRDAGFTDLDIAAEKSYDLGREIAVGLRSITLTARKPA